MAEHSLIEWTDATWNIVTGCSVVSPGCTNCYAMRLAGTRLRHHPSRAGLTIVSKAGPVWNGVTRVNWEWIDQPLSWRRQRMIFVCAHGDLFHESVEWETIAQIYGVMIAAHHLRGHILQVLTKRSARARELLNSDVFWDIANANAGMLVMDHVDPLDRRSDDARATLDDYGVDNPPPGIWLGVSVEDQARADERIPHLLQTPALVRWLSCEPLLGEVRLDRIHETFDGGLGHSWESCLNGQRFDPWSDGMSAGHPRLDWVVAGGESGPGARPMHPGWARGLRDQCAAAGVPFFFKQWGDWAPGESTASTLGMPLVRTADWFNDSWVYEDVRGDFEWHADDEPILFRAGKKAAGRLLDGVTHDAMPQVRA